MEAAYRANAQAVGGAIPPQPQQPPLPQQQPRMQQPQQQQRQQQPAVSTPEVPTPLMPPQPLPRGGSPASPPAEAAPRSSGPPASLPAPLLPPTAEAAPQQAPQQVPLLPPPSPPQASADQPAQHTAAAAEPIAAAAGEFVAEPRQLMQPGASAAGEPPATDSLLADCNETAEAAVQTAADGSQPSVDALPAAAAKPPALAVAPGDGPTDFQEPADLEHDAASGQVQSQHATVSAVAPPMGLPIAIATSAV